MYLLLWFINNVVNINNINNDVYNVYINNIVYVNKDYLIKRFSTKYL